MIELAAAARGLPLVVVGDGPLRDVLPQTVGFVPHDELGPYYERASIVVVPSRREGYGVTAREAMAYGRPVVTTGVGGLATRSTTASPVSSCHPVTRRPARGAGAAPRRCGAARDPRTRGSRAGPNDPLVGHPRPRRPCRRTGTLQGIGELATPETERMPAARCKNLSGTDEPERRCDAPQCEGAALRGRR